MATQIDIAQNIQKKSGELVATLSTMSRMKPDDPMLRQALDMTTKIVELAATAGQSAFDSRTSTKSPSARSSSNHSRFGVFKQPQPASTHNEAANTSAATEETQDNRDAPLAAKTTMRAGNR